MEAFSPIYFDNPKKLSCIILAMNLIKILTVEAQSNVRVYELIKKFYDILRLDNWINNYIFWELELLKIIGYDLELKDLVDKKIVDNKTYYFAKTSNQTKQIPSFLIEKNNKESNLDNLLKGLKLVGDYMEKSILKPNNLNYPISRREFITNLK